MTKNVLYVGNYLKGPDINPSYMFTLGPLLEGLGYELQYTSSRLNKVWRLCNMLATVIKRHKSLNVVVIDTYSTQNFYFAVCIGYLCRLYKLPYIPILHGGELPSRLKRSPKLSMTLFENAFQNVAPSGYLNRAFRDQGIDNVVVIPNVLDLNNYKFKPRQESSLNILWVRKISKIYNPMMAIEVLKYLKDKGYDAKLCMVGGGVDDALESLSQFAANHQLQVEFKGQLTRLEWIELSKGYDYFLNTSTIDNTPLSVIEAMALGLAVVSTNVGGLPYLIENKVNGILVQPNDGEAMAEAVLRLKEQPKLFRVITQRARQKVEQFDAQVVGQQWVELLENVSKSSS